MWSVNDKPNKKKKKDVSFISLSQKIEKYNMTYTHSEFCFIRRS